MKINVGYDTKSIDKAIKQIEEYQKKVQSLIPTFLHRCMERIKELANDKLSLEGGALGIGSQVISEIQNGWQPPKITQTATSATALLENNVDKSVYIEFGVGFVGQQSSNAHKLADEVGYQYNLPSPSKHAGQHHDENTWRFYVGSKNEIDLATGTYEEWQTKSGRIKIITQGSPSVMYAYQAVMDFAQSREPADIMEDLLKGL